VTLTNYAYLEIEGESATATFEFNRGLEISGNLVKSYLMGERGNYLREVINQTPGTGSFDADRRTGFWIDGGAGDWQVTLAFETGVEDIQWGDGDGGTGPGNVTTTDASGADVKPITRLQILQYWLAKSKSDSGGTTRLHHGEWTDGEISNVDSSNIDAGAFGQPMPVAIRETNVDKPVDDPPSMTGSITMSHVALWGGAEAPDWIQDAIGAAQDAADIIPDE